MAHDTTTSQACLICEKPNSKLCSVCKSSAYCSTECQKKDWKIHKLLCKDFSEFDLKSRPTPAEGFYFRGFVFLENEQKPKCAWIKAIGDADGGLTYKFGRYTNMTHEATEEALDGLSIFARGLPVDDSHPLGLIHLRYREHFLGDGSALNKNITKILKTHPNPNREWCGPVIAVGINHPTNGCRDLDMNDFRDIAEYFITCKCRTKRTEKFGGI